jgi:hypothetical protein
MNNSKFKVQSRRSRSERDSKPKVPVRAGFKVLLSALCAICAIGGFTAFAQDPQPAPPTSPQTFFQTLGQWFSSQNTNLDTFQSDRFSLWAGMDNLGNSLTTASIGGDFYLGAADTNGVRSGLGALSLEGNFRNATVAGTVVTAQAGFGYSWVSHDIKLTAFLDGGNRFDTHQPYLAGGVRIKKALTPNTFAGIGIELPIYLNHQSDLSPTFSIFTGFKL